MRAHRVERVLVIGLDCATPQFILGPDRLELPHLEALAAAGASGVLASCSPPITVPAWACMTSGKDPGTLGCYGFRNRRDHSYAPMVTADATAIREPRLWDMLSRAGREVVCLGVPQTYPPKPVNGCLVSGLLTPDTSCEYTYPKSLSTELERALGTFILDVDDFRTDDKEGLLKRIHAFMHNRFDAAEYLMASKPWDFFMMVEMGLDRLHHAFWQFCDPDHPRYEPGNAFADAFRVYYQTLDARIGRLLSTVGDETAVLVVSDHGAKALHGGVCMNQWLMNEGHLAVHDRVDGVRRIEDCRIDWSKTRAWSTGGYYARIFLNVEGREPEGVIAREDYESFRDGLIDTIEAMAGPGGNPLGNRALKPEAIYSSVRGIAPDLVVYLGDLHWRCVGSVGHDSVYVSENDTGPDGANHAMDGLIIMDDRSGRGGVELAGARLPDVASTVLSLLSVDVPADLQGVSLV